MHCDPHSGSIEIPTADRWNPDHFVASIYRLGRSAESRVPHLAIFTLCEGRICALIAAYFDESSDAKAERVFTLGAYIALTRDWVHDFEPPWEELLKKHNLDYFRATDCENGTGPFKQFRSDPLPLPLRTEDKAKLTQIKTEFVDLALSRRYMWGLGVNVFVDDLRSF